MENQPKTPLDLDPRTFETLKWSAVWNAVASAIENVFAYVSLFFIGGYTGQILSAFGGIAKTFPIGQLVKDACWGAVYGAIGGFVLSKFYPQIQNLNRKYLKGWLNTFFKLLFYPSLAGSIIGFFMSSVASFAIGFMPIIIIVAGSVLSSYIYAKMMTQKVGSKFPPPL